MRIPSLDNPDLGYETGVHLGDGSLWDHRYLISGNREKETDYYENVLAPLIHELYSVKPSLAFQDNSVYLRVYSKDLVDFKHSKLGLPIGRKTGLMIPEFARSNYKVEVKLVSGLYDTDGSVKVRHDKSGNYPRISLAQKHEGLVSEAMGFLRYLGITSTMYRNDYFDPRSGKVETRWFLDINGFRNFDAFMAKIGTRSPYVERRIEMVRKQC